MVQQSPSLRYSNMLVPAVPGWAFGCSDPWVFSIMCTQNLIEVVHETWVVVPEVAVDPFPVQILLVHILIQVERKGFPFLVEVTGIEKCLFRSRDLASLFRSKTKIQPWSDTQVFDDSQWATINTGASFLHCLYFSSWDGPDDGMSGENGAGCDAGLWFDSTADDLDTGIR